MISIFIIDDHPIICQALTDFLSAYEDFQVVGAVTSVGDALPQIEEHRPQVILLDLELGDGDGASFIPQLLQIVPNTHILIFTGAFDENSITRSMKAGAKGYLLKGTRTDEIAQAIRVVRSGGGYLAPQVASKLMEGLTAFDDSSKELSEREREVLKLVAEGLPNKSIASNLGISTSTVKFHLSSLFSKLDVDNRAQAVALALQKGWI